MRQYFGSGFCDSADMFRAVTVMRPKRGKVRCNFCMGTGRNFGKRCVICKGRCVVRYTPQVRLMNAERPGAYFAIDKAAPGDDTTAAVCFMCEHGQPHRVYTVYDYTSKRTLYFSPSTKVRAALEAALGIRPKFTASEPEWGDPALTDEQAALLADIPFAVRAQYLNPIAEIEVLRSAAHSYRALRHLQEHGARFRALHASAEEAAAAFQNMSQAFQNVREWWRAQAQQAHAGVGVSFVVKGSADNGQDEDATRAGDSGGNRQDKPFTDDKHRQSSAD